MRTVPLILCSAMLAASAWASEPGQPLDCTDWLLNEPGLSCSVLIPSPCEATAPRFCVPATTPTDVTDNQGRPLRTHYLLGDNILGYCGWGRAINRIEIWALEGQTERLLASITHRCNDAAAPTPWRDYIDPAGFGGSSGGDFAATFDPINGRLIMALHSQCEGEASQCDYPNPGFTLVAIEGFPTLFETLQSYSTGPLSYSIPQYPEGLAAADHFDTYTGPLPGPKDFSQAEGLRCEYPSAIPQAGDYLEVADPLPDPAIGEGRYYVTAVTYQGETRYGRKANGGVLSGRDPAELPDCVEPPPLEDGVGDGEQP